MWAELATWIAQDEGFELAVDDLWKSKLAVSLDGAEELDQSVPLGIHLLHDPRSIEEPAIR